MQSIKLREVNLKDLSDIPKELTPLRLHEEEQKRKTGYYNIISRVLK
jgi:hypothetical protein